MKVARLEHSVRDATGETRGWVIRGILADSQLQQAE